MNNRGKWREAFKGPHNPRVFGSSPNGPIDNWFTGSELQRCGDSSDAIHCQKSGGVPKLYPTSERPCAE